jgi:Uma2 family endonuclease
MSTTTTPAEVYYPDTDGEPMSDNTLQFRWIVTIQGNLDLLFRDRADVFVAGNNLIYPVQGDPTIRQAPDVYVAFGRPKGDRGSYKVWEEGGVFPQVVFEVWSPGNRAGEMTRKRAFYRTYGAEEYYVYDPEENVLEGWVREGDRFEEVASANGHVSPRLGVRFDLSGSELAIRDTNGRQFLTFVELGDIAARERERARNEHERAEKEWERAEKLAAKLRELGIDPDAV